MNMRRRRKIKYFIYVDEHWWYGRQLGWVHISINPHQEGDVCRVVYTGHRAFRLRGIPAGFGVQVSRLSYHKGRTVWDDFSLDLLSYDCYHYRGGAR